MTAAQDSAAERIEIRAEFAASPDESYHTATTVAVVTNRTEAKLAVDRMAGRGVPYYKIDKSIRYRAGDVREYLERRRVLTNNEAPADKPMPGGLTRMAERIAATRKARTALGQQRFTVGLGNQFGSGHLDEMIAHEADTYHPETPRREPPR